VLLLGTSDQHLRRIRDSVPAKISARNNKIHVSGEETAVFQATEFSNSSRRRSVVKAR